MILGHSKQWKLLQRCAREGNFSHAYLFSGTEKIGKKKVALEWLSLLLEKDVEKSQHPDFLYLEPQEKEIQISQIRNLIWKLSLKPYSAPLKAAVIDRAHLMNQEAQTSLLKTLEEPRGNSLIILVTEEPENLLPTIVSRVQTVKFYPVSEKEISDYLKKQGVSENEAGEILKISSGRPGAALEFLAAPERVDSFNRRVKDLNRIISGNLAFRFEYVRNLSENPSEIKETLNIWLSSFRGLLFSRIVKGEARGNQYSIGRIRDILENIQKTIHLISNTNINSRLALETLMLEI